MGTACEREPLVLPLQDVQVNSTIPDSFMKGIPARIGTPEQQIVLLPWPDLNNSWIYDEQAYCDPTRIFSDTICLVRRGNYYREDGSSTFHQALDVISAGGAQTELSVTGSQPGVKNLISSGLGGTDTLRLGSSAPLEAYPFGIPRLDWDSGYTTLHALGFGSNSTYFNALLEARYISSKVWSIFWGRMWLAPTPMDGAIVLGGYDRAKILGRNLTRSLDYGPNGCWTGMSVDIHDIRVNFGSGSEESVFPPNAVLPVCLVPQRQLLLEAPGIIFDNFQNVTGTTSTGVSVGLHWGAQKFDTGTQFTGDITFELADGFSVRVPNDQYVVPWVAIDYNSSRIFNESQREVLISRLGSQPPVLGRYFFTAAYLMVDQDAGTFTLWQANPSKKQDLVAVTNNRPLASCSADDPAVPSSLASDSDSELSASGLSGGSVAGIVMGVLAFVAGLSLIALFIWRRRRNQKTVYAAAPQEIPGPYEVAGSCPQKSSILLTEASSEPTHREPAIKQLGELHGTEAFDGNRLVYELDGRAQSSPQTRGETP